MNPPQDRRLEALQAPIESRLANCERLGGLPYRKRSRVFLRDLLDPTRGAFRLLETRSLAGLLSNGLGMRGRDLGRCIARGASRPETSADRGIDVGGCYARY